MTEIYDLSGLRRDGPWLEATYGARCVPCGAEGLAFRLAQVHETEGPATITVRVQQQAPCRSSETPFRLCRHGETGQDGGLASHAVAFSWPDGPVDLTTREAQVFLTRYKPRAAVQWTGPDGYTGFGLGTGSYIQDLAQGGPHAVWVLHHQYPSDVLDGVGMLGGTEHRGPLQMVFSLAEAAVVEPSPPPITDGIEVGIRYAVWNRLNIPFNPDAAFSKKARDLGLGAPLTVEQIVGEYAMQGFTGGILWAKVGDWGNVQLLAW